jgi:hypothetical protein
MTDDLVKRLRSRKAYNAEYDFHGDEPDKECQEAADRIEKLGASESEWRPICDSYAAENQRFSDRIEKLEAALKKISYLPFGGAGFNPLTLSKFAREALEGKDE